MDSLMTLSNFGQIFFFSTFLADNPLKKEELDIFVHFILKMGAYSSKS
jgi:hypothetical protein